jgi:hypothetical protein
MPSVRLQNMHKISSLSEVHSDIILSIPFASLASSKNKRVIKIAVCIIFTITSNKEF